VSEQQNFKYDVAISFLGDDLDLAEELAKLLQDRMSVFLFTERQGEIAGSDGLDTLSLMFGSQARLGSGNARRVPGRLAATYGRVRTHSERWP
jgi:hypothetical protein